MYYATCRMEYLNVVRMSVAPEVAAATARPKEAVDILRVSAQHLCCTLDALPMISSCPQCSTLLHCRRR